MQTIIQKINKGEAKRLIKFIAENQLLELEIRLIYALDFTPHKVEYYRERIRQHRATYNF